MKAIEQRRKMAGQGGFTLIELLVVIAILGVLAGVVVFAVGGINNNSKESACKAERSTIETAFEAFNAQENEYPTSYTDTTAGGKAFVPGFLRTAPDTAKWTTSFTPAPGDTPTISPTAGGDCVGF